MYQMKKRILVAIAIVVFIGLAYLFFASSFIVLTLSSANSNSTRYTLSNQKGDQLTEGVFAPGSTSIKKWVWRGSYNVSVFNNNSSSYFSVEGAKGFLRSTVVNIDLKHESSIKFIGDNPKSCMSNLGDKLVSFTCGSLLSETTLHNPASSSTPTYVSKPLKSSIVGEIEGVIDLSGSDYFLVRKSNLETASQQHVLLKMNSDLSIADEVLLSSLDSKKTYSIIKHKSSGFLIYSEDLTEVFIFSQLSSAPELIRIDAPTTKQIEPLSLDSYGDSIFTLHSSGYESKQASEVIIRTNDGFSTHTKLKDVADYAISCGDQKICVQADNKLRVFEVKDGKPKEIYQVSNVSAVRKHGNDILLINNLGVIEFNADSRKGWYSYVLGDYKFKSIAVNNSDYLLSLRNNKGRNVALLIQVGVKKDSIDKQVLSLQKLKEVSYVSIYDSYIYVSANLGELVYNEELRSYTYNPSTQQSAAIQINTEIDRLGIDRSKYTITSNAF